MVEVGDSGVVGDSVEGMGCGKGASVGGSMDYLRVWWCVVVHATTW